MPVERDPYVCWLSNARVPLFKGAGTVWRLHQGRYLLQASLKPEPIHLSLQNERDLLRSSGALFVRYFTTTFDAPTQFWYTECAKYDPDTLDKDTRRQIRQGRERCEIRQVTPEWLATNGYPCYLSAFARYRGGQPEPYEMFRRDCFEAAAGPFEYWGAFVAGRLVSFIKCVVGDDYAICSELKVDPEFLTSRPAYALNDRILTRYVKEQGKRLHEGFRPVSHQTNVHDFFLRFGYRKIFCDMRIHYRLAMAALVNLLYPLRNIIERSADLAVARNASVLLKQEEIRRSFVRPARTPRQQPSNS